MKLETIVENSQIITILGNRDIEITGIENDSRKVSRGNMFIAIKGFTVDGHDYIDSAIDKGAICIVVSKDIPLERDDITFIRVDDTIDALSEYSSIFYGEPSRRLQVMGITGTNGKTSITYMIQGIFEEASRHTGIIGTMGSNFAGKVLDNRNTTPNSLIIQRQLNEMLDAGMEFCAMEVSSHALELRRVRDVDFQVGIFTNLTEEHLDFHRTMEDYYNSKLKLFNRTKAYNIVNGDDIYGRRILQEVGNEVPMLTYGIDGDYDVYATDVDCHIAGVDFTLNTRKGSIPIELKLLGRFNVYNALAAISCGMVYDIDLPTIKRGIEGIANIKGRFEIVPIDRDYSVIIDYAHTPDGLEEILSTIDQFAEGRKIVVFGAGGNRDRTKRPIMGETVARHADLAIVTSDNPRFEDPKAIIEDILVGIRKIGGDHVVIVDRRKAIEYALSIAMPDDIIVLAGKGHETYTIMEDRVIDFDERQIVLDILGDMHI
ncbi:MAG: UDP-N-acetylmuramoyl-L-alanyl-D-glutamate--2,6-diaminopimelate ligase [Tissierellia bacterium]|nr:UDP-N-acetylmuramoyl-L-alanyl-D-glutamate--2,6-diaminopimelate ligase [Tissierellia bacterium]